MNDFAILIVFIMGIALGSIYTISMYLIITTEILLYNINNKTNNIIKQNKMIAGEEIKGGSIVGIKNNGKAYNYKLREKI